MRVEELHLKNFRCFKELDITFPAANLAVFIGANGSGKTAILDAIAISLNDYIKENKQHYNSLSDLNYHVDDLHYHSSSTENKIVFKYNSEKKTHTSHYINTEENNPVSDDQKLESFIRELSQEGILFNYRFLCVYYKIDRKSNIHVLSAESTQEDFKELEDWLSSELALENDIKIDSGNIDFSNPRMNVVRKAMSTFFYNITDANFSKLRYKRSPNIATRSYDLYITFREIELKLSQFSEGQRLLISIVCDIARHLLKINKIDVVIETPKLDGDNNFLEWDYEYPDYTEEAINAILERSGIVLIDEIELHLHPQWQREVLPALQKTFPNIQFIITTHSPQTLSKVDKDNIFILHDNHIYQPSSNPIGRDSNDILEEIMNVTKRPKEIQELSDNYFSLLNKNLFEKAKTFREKLEQQLDKDDPIFIRADAFITRKNLLQK
ncbi:MAG: AAA family ATPase [Methylococcaceae bacterium]|nr:AAA family ATPase [Methylococcaceae bacterium]